jgi:NAD(P)-dependent dehydrogenase (short-subunit alcohol dehydrogenase family)
VIHGIQAAYPRMVRQGFGHIVNTASFAGLVSAPLIIPYAAAKHAVVGISATLRVEGRAHGVRCSAVCPGLIATSIFDRIDYRRISAEAARKMLPRPMARRRAGSANDRGRALTPRERARAIRTHGRAHA